MEAPKNDCFDMFVVTAVSILELRTTVADISNLL